MLAKGNNLTILIYDIIHTECIWTQQSKQASVDKLQASIPIML